MSMGFPVGINNNQYYQYFLPQNFNPGSCPINDPSFAQSYMNMLNWRSLIPMRQPPPPPPLPPPGNPIQQKKLNDFLNTKNDSKDEVTRWVKARIRNFPTKKNIEMKAHNKECSESMGIASHDDLSLLELKLRKKLKMITNTRKKKRFDNPESNLEAPRKERTAPSKPNVKEDNKANTKEDIKEKEKAASLNHFKYIKNDLLEHLIKSEEIHECNILLQCFRHFIKEGLAK